MGGHLKSIAQISQHVDELTKAALEDIKDHDGSGHHFRAATLALGIPGRRPQGSLIRLATPTACYLSASDHRYSHDGRLATTTRRK